jgi:uncharacterized protein YrrD
MYYILDQGNLLGYTSDVYRAFRLARALGLRVSRGFLIQMDGTVVFQEKLMLVDYSLDFLL